MVLACMPYFMIVRPPCCHCLFREGRSTISKFGWGDMKEGLSRTHTHTRFSRRLTFFPRESKVSSIYFPKMVPKIFSLLLSFIDVKSQIILQLPSVGKYDLRLSGVRMSKDCEPLSQHFSCSLLYSDFFP